MSSRRPSPWIAPSEEPRRRARAPGRSRKSPSSSVTAQRTRPSSARRRPSTSRPDPEPEERTVAAYTYEAINADGLRMRGEIHAADATTARDQLRSRGLLARSLSERTASGEGAAARFKRVKPKSLQVFSRQLATMIEAGVSVVAALTTLEQQTDDKYLGQVIGEVRSDVEAGLVLSKAFARHPKVFNRLFVAMVEAGESSGTLDSVLDRVAIQIEKDNTLRRRVKGAMVYPILVMSFAVLVLTFMLMFIIPVFQNVFTELGGQLPTPTKILVGMSEGLRG